MCVVQAKRNDVPAIYNSAVATANRRCSSFDRILAEPLAAQVRCRFRAGPEAGDDARRAVALRFERRERRIRRGRLDSVALELVPDALVTESALREGDGSSKGIALVVEVPDAFQRLEGLGAPVLGHARTFEPLVDLPAGAVAMLERPGGDLDGIGVGRHGRALHSC